jgi:hypothetical protein
MSDWQKITPTSPTDEECKSGVLFVNADGSVGVTWRNSSIDHDRLTHWMPFPPSPPRPDPAKEACDHARDLYFRLRSGGSTGKDIFDYAWYAAVAWKEGTK